MAGFVIADGGRGGNRRACATRRDAGGALDAWLYRRFLDLAGGMSRLAWGAAFLAVAVLVLLELAVFLLMRPRELAGDRGES